MTNARNSLIKTQQEAAVRAAHGQFVDAISNLIAPTGFMSGTVRDGGRGPTSVRAFLLRDTLNVRSSARWTILRSDVSADGRDGYTFGYLDVIRQKGDTLLGGFQAYWRRNGSGSWQILALARSRREDGAVDVPDIGAIPHATNYRVWPVSDSVAAWASLKATEIAFSDSSASGMRAAFMTFAAVDAGKLTGARYVFGKDAIGEPFRTPPPGFAGIQWHAEWGTVAASNDLGFNVGPVTSRAPPSGAPNGPGGLFFTIWRRQSNGEWRFEVD